ncbi:MAG: hypothetical protein R3B57_14730 [Phycisphaerales bacterium]
MGDQGPANQAATPEARVRALLGLGGGGAIDHDRAMELLARALESLVAIDQVVGGTWEQIAPGSGLRPGAVKRAGSAYLDGRSSEKELSEELAAARVLAASMLAAVSRAGQVAWRHAARLAPERVEGLARSEKKWNESVEFAAWRKYKELAGELDAASFETEIMEAIAKYVEDLAEKRRRATAGGGA